MRISTIMAAYNAERYVAAALNSILAQTFPSEEIVVVDDGSTDGTSDVLQTYAGRIQIIRQANRGPARAFNVGISAVTGDALAFLDSDDLWVPEKLEIQRKALSAEPQLEAVFGLMQQFVSPDAQAENYLVPDAPQPGIGKSALLIHRRAFERIGLFDETYNAIDFVDWYARATRLGLRWRMLSEVVAWRRHHSENLGRRKRTQEHAELLEVLKRSAHARRARSARKERR
jgi:glycosyltransferase involved in cell wall biosynthesis